MNIEDYELTRVILAQDWNVYHWIRREELFRTLGMVETYNYKHPDEVKSGNFPLLLKFNGYSIGTVRIDLKNDGEAVIRLLAITKTEQSKGHGKILMKKIETFARTKKVKKLLVNARKDAVGYYQKNDFVFEDWDTNELVGISIDSIQMSKVI